jgi:hypothetical protein
MPNIPGIARSHVDGNARAKQKTTQALEFRGREG